MDIISKYFPDLQPAQVDQISRLLPLYEVWNSRINVISRKDIDQLYERHVLHSLSIARVIQFSPGTRIVDIGTGGGFPGIPLAILFPEAEFHLVDSIGKKIKVVEEIVAALKLQNVSFEKNRAESLTEQYDFVVSRAVSPLPQFVSWTSKLILPNGNNKLENGILYLKGGDIKDELKRAYKKSRVWPISNFFTEPYFETKSVIHLY